MMSRMRWAAVLGFSTFVPTALVACSLLTLAGCGNASGTSKDGGKTSSSKPSIRIDGSSTVYPVSQAVAEEFQKLKKNEVLPVVAFSGTGGGFKKFCVGELDISDASRPISQKEMEEARKNSIEYLELPICFDALTVAVNPKNDWCDSMTVEELNKMWSPDSQDKITKWSQIREGWPDEPFKLFGAGTDSGTFDYFTEAINGKSKACRTDFTPSEDDNNLVRGIEGDKYALGFIPYSYYAAQGGKLKGVAISWSKNKVKEAVAPSEEAVLNGTYNPLSRPLFIYVSRKALDRPEVKEFVEFYLKEGPALIKSVKYMPLPDKAYEMARTRLEKMQTGTGFGGTPEIGLPVEDILKRAPKS